jgi:NADH-quinone oxidoreductase subunit I
MYCGICVEVCPFDALHWSPYFEYNSYTYEGMIHESDVLQGWQEHVLPPPPLVADADPKAQELQKVAHDKRVDGVWGVIREQDKKDAYLAQQAGAPVATAAPAAVPVAAPAAAAETPAPAAEAAPAAAEPAPPQPAAEAAPPAAEAAPPADLGDVPRVDPSNLPDGIGPVERGRLKKLAELQHRGEAPTTDPVDLVAVLKPILDQMRA